MPKLAEDLLARLKAHKYSATGLSVMEPYLKPFFDFLISYMPMWVAPNLITVAGLAVNIVTSLILVYFNPAASTDVEVPSWAYYSCAVGILIYEILDALDGKQARRTGSASPLGELFDHGCDSLSTSFVAVASTISLQLGNGTWTVVLCFMSMFMFYAAHWECYVKGILRFNFIDATEVQWLLITIHSLTGYFGPQIWQTEFFGYEIKIILLVVTIFNGLLTFLRNLNRILEGGAGEDGSTIAETSVLSPVIPPFLLMLEVYFLHNLGVLDAAPMFFLLGIGMIFAKLTNKIILAHMSKSVLPLVDIALVIPGIYYINNMFLGIDMYWMNCIFFNIMLIDLGAYCSTVCSQIATYMNIRVFKIPYKKKD